MMSVFAELVTVQILNYYVPTVEYFKLIGFDPAAQMLPKLLLSTSFFNALKSTEKPAMAH